MKNKKNNQPSSQGFTLIELMVAVTIFVLVALVTTSTLLLIMDAARRANATRSLVDNLNFALDNMTDKIKYGNTYTFDNSVGVNCFSQFSFMNNRVRNNKVTYNLLDSKIWQSVDNGDRRALTSTEIVITSLKFCDTRQVIRDIGVDGSTGNVLIEIMGHYDASSSRGGAEYFNLQTTISQEIST